MKKCRPVVKEPSGGTLLFRFALPARGASLLPLPPPMGDAFASALPARGASLLAGLEGRKPLSLPRRCLHGVHRRCRRLSPWRCPLPRRCLHGVHLPVAVDLSVARLFASALPARGASAATTLYTCIICFASALPARGASLSLGGLPSAGPALPRRCLHGVHHDELAGGDRPIHFASALPARGASTRPRATCSSTWTLPRRCLHGVHRR